MDWKYGIVCFLWKYIVNARAAVPTHCHHFMDKSSSLETVECFGKHITRIPPGISNTTQALYIHEGNISLLHIGSFENLILLQRLRLISCQIQKIKSGTFRNLNNLTEMYLNQNNLELSKNVYVVGLFRGLQNLKVLHLGRNSNVRGPIITYPDSVWEDLPNLEDLYIDGIYNEAFPGGFSKLRSLRNLTLSGTMCYCDIYHLRKNSFSAFANISLQCIDLSKCKIHVVDEMIFAQLQKLQSIIFFDQDCSLKDVKNILSGLNQTSIQYLQLNKVFRLGSYTLTSDLFIPVHNSTLLHLYLDDNSITWVDDDALKYLPRTVQTISINGNYLLGANLAAIQLLLFPNLTSFTISILVAKWQPRPITIPLPLALEEITLSGMYTDTTMPPLTINTRNNIRSVTVTNSAIHTFSGYVRGLNKLERYSSVNVNCNNISRGYFRFFEKLKYLNLSRNFLSDMLSADDSGDYFIGLNKLEVLDISQNGLRNLSTNLLMNPLAIKELHIQRNSLVQFDPKIGHLKQLRYFDLSTNSLSVLDDTTINELSYLIHANNLTLDISDNPLSCSCQSLHFLSWMQINQAHFNNYDKYKCNLRNQAYVDEATSDLQSECASYATLILLTSVGIAIFVVVLMAGVFYRYHMHMKYWFHIVRRNFRKSMERQKNDFKYDAFVSYEDSVEEFVLNTMLPECENRRQLKLCIHCRDFMPGVPITDNIVGAIQCSRKSIFIISREFPKSEWCRFEFNMARMEHIFFGRPTIVVVMYEPVEELPLDILAAVSSETYVNYENRDAFWDLLACSVKGEQI